MNERNPAPTIVVTLPNGASALVEVDERGAPGETMVAARAYTMDGVREAIEGYCGVVLAAMKVVSPSNCDVEMAFKIATEAGALTALLVNGTAEASIKVTLTWKREIH